VGRPQRLPRERWTDCAEAGDHNKEIRTNQNIEFEDVSGTDHPASPRYAKSQEVRKSKNNNPTVRDISCSTSMDRPQQTDGNPSKQNKAEY
jgi:hypothetical protein